MTREDWRGDRNRSFRARSNCRRRYVEGREIKKYVSKKKGEVLMLGFCRITTTKTEDKKNKEQWTIMVLENEKELEK